MNLQDLLNYQLTTQRGKYVLEYQSRIYSLNYQYGNSLYFRCLKSGCTGSVVAEINDDDDEDVEIEILSQECRI